MLCAELGGGDKRETDPHENWKVRNFKKLVAQPCQPHDSCHNRCVNDWFTFTANVTLGHFNCFCDNDCETFG